MKIWLYNKFTFKTKKINVNPLKLKNKIIHFKLVINNTNENNILCIRKREKSYLFPCILIKLEKSKTQYFS